MSYIREQQEEKVHDALKQMFANKPGQRESGHMFTVGAVQLAHTSENRKQKEKDLGHTEMTSVQ